MDKKALLERTKKFHIDVIKLCEALPRMQQALNWQSN